MNKLRIVSVLRTVLWIRIRKDPKLDPDPELEVMDPVPDPDPKLDLNLTKNHEKN
jgi:hypothetical protein